MNVLLIGSGGREHALVWKISQSMEVDKIFCAPGNAGTTEIAENVVLDAADHQAVVNFCRLMGVGLVVIGPEAPLVDGLADTLNENDIPVFGPSARAAQLEGSKGFTKDLCAEYDIPTAAYARFNNAPKAKTYIRQQGAPIVIKADGLAAGKGVVVAMTLSDALEAVDDCFEGGFGDAGAEVVVEAFLEGEEASFFFLCDGKTALPFGTAQDHKRVGDGDTGSNTGGMGAYSPAPVLTEALQRQVIDEIIEPTMRGMRERGMPFIGVLYCGLMLTENGPQLIEYNARFGDPECQVLMMRLADDIVPLLLAAAKGNLPTEKVEWIDHYAMTIVMATSGYPGAYDKGSEIKNISGAEETGAAVFHAGTGFDNGKIVATGGRVLNVTALGETVSAAQANAYKAVEEIDWPEGFYRRDIGWRAIELEKSS